ncbi:mandelate racemase/muconate lactonizing enzyme family protein (plasmid) [Bosea vestrisii]|uniref:mandelate racemase/muconate lactonizing enzyme family protein n=1 Tax=Bosea vestrisii TaxID=151416 RepID=UPI0024E01CD2|nr:mandelate racemase/muconate lactonizing enzyme family protein [Bosea vestrisii]WID99928.1 mandelate racemase/muconate lactonizing enzyme family protein [Bosea vestrisii]
MKIKSATVYSVQGQGLKPVIVKLETYEGIVGLGETAISYGCGGTGAAGMIKDLCARFVIGANATGINALVAEMYDQSFWLKNPGGIAGAGLSAIEQALWDIRARSLGVPVYDLFGGRMRDDLAYYANGWYFGAKSVGELVTKAVAAARDGHSALKMYPLARIQPNGTLRHPTSRYADERDAVRGAVGLVQQVRKAIGADVGLVLDLAGGLSVSDTIRFCRDVEDCDIGFVEEVSDPGDLGSLRRVADATSIPIATGERHYMRYGFRDVFESRSVSILQPDIGNAGGFAEVHKIAAMGEAYSLKVQPHVCGSSVAASVAMHMSACLPNFYVQEHFPYWTRVPGYIEVATQPFDTCARDGAIRVSDAPGFGVTLDDKVMQEHVWAHLS